MNRLCNHALSTLPASVRRPSYDRSALTPGIVHIGVGGFHRAHQAVYLDDLFNLGVGHEWGLVGVGLLEHDRVMADALIPQDCLYSVIEQDIRGNAARVVGAMIDFVHAPSDPRRAMELLCDPRIRIVSMTITEGGYNIDQASGKFLTSNEAIQQEARGAVPLSVFGYVVGALAERRKRGVAPFTVLSCDNVVHNGRIAAGAFCAFAEMRDPELAEWVRSSVSFPNTMVDRITPATSPETRALAAEMLGLDDRWPVACESFKQWVIEDSFCNGRPELERVGVQMTSDVTPYEVMKIRLLNAGHSAIGYLGYLCGFEHIFEIMADADFQRFIAAFWDDEVTPHVAEVPGVDLGAYKRSLFERFSNPNIRDQSLRICSDGSNKLPKFLLPTIREALETGAPMRRMCLVVASWIRFMSGRDELGRAIPPSDPREATIQPIARRGPESLREVLRMEGVFGSLGESEAFVAEVDAALRDLYELGARKTLQKYL